MNYLRNRKKSKGGKTQKETHAQRLQLTKTKLKKNKKKLKQVKSTMISKNKTMKKKGGLGKNSLKKNQHERCL